MWAEKTCPYQTNLLTLESLGLYNLFERVTRSALMVYYVNDEAYFHHLLLVNLERKSGNTSMQHDNDYNWTCCLFVGLFYKGVEDGSKEIKSFTILLI